MYTSVWSAFKFMYNMHYWFLQNQNLASGPLELELRRVVRNHNSAGSQI